MRNRLTERDLSRIVKRVVNEGVVLKKTLEDLKRDPFVNKTGTVETTPEGLKITLDGISTSIIVRQ